MQQADWPLILTTTRLRNNHLSGGEKLMEHVERARKDRYLVIQGSDGADTWQANYRFQNYGGCWYLQSVRRGGT